MKQLISFLKSFKFAFEGIIYTVRKERNVRVHLTCLVYMMSFLTLTDWFVISKVELAILLLTSALVISLEFVNTAIESTVNLVTTEFKPLAKIAKDTAAAAVLVAAVFAVAIGLVILFQPSAFKLMFEYFATHLLSLATFIASLVVAIIFIFVGVPSKKDK
ncbi:MAG: diacylglycerol kinase family protein [Clostridia bacterium]